MARQQTSRSRRCWTVAALAGAVLAVGCGETSGASSTPAPSTPSASSSSASKTASPTASDGEETVRGDLSAHVASAPSGYRRVEHGSKPYLSSEAFRTRKYLTDHSAKPKQGRKALKVSGFTDGYHLYARSSEHWVHIYLYRQRTAAGADRLSRIFWRQRDSGGSRFAVHGIPGARGSVNQPSYVRAEVRFTVGNVYADVYANTHAGRADTKVATELAKKQYRKLTAALS